MNLLFIGTRVLPAICIAGATQLVFVNTFFPMTDEQRKEIERIRRERREVALKERKNKGMLYSAMDLGTTAELDTAGKRGADSQHQFPATKDLADQRD